jgi:hypothetical protein
MLSKNQAAQLPVHLAMQHAQHTSTWEAILAIQAHRQRAQAVLLHLADRYLADLPEYVIKVFGARTEARQVTISASQQRHILERRQVVSEIDADLCAYRLAEALQHLTHWIQSQRDPRVYEVIAKLPSAGRHLMIALKLVPGTDSRSRRDEWWIRTAHPFGAKRMRRMLATDALRLLQ